ncbi:hypothetical protein MWU61_12230 [Loktanella sp. F6476L]|uniref:hypothetical protein n=1 Tax=Loktanella sp. F6476L TaxID=2926405 RepID=UPI001FF3D219|nr:hypothetical protein [Loktanella sp. F6476L]MCK0121312.1 hypothetical protein [Loktanella sp. F6476L]
MTPMMIKILNQSIEAVAQGTAGHEIDRSHYDRYRGMQKIVNRLAAMDLVILAETVAADKIILTPTTRAYDVMQNDASKAAIYKAA